MALSSLPLLVLKPVTGLVSAALGGVPKATETRAARPLQRADAIAKRASAKAAAISATLSLPPGPMGLLTVLPDMILVWRIQAQMVVDIAAAFGKADHLSEVDITSIMFKHVSTAAMADYNRNVPLDQPEPPLDLRELISRMASKRGEVINRFATEVTSAAIERITKRVITRLVPLGGTLIVSAQAALDTTAVAKTAIEIFSGERSKPTRRPRARQANVPSSQ
jgi:uncharacterized protein (DUF697 family)